MPLSPAKKREYDRKRYKNQRAKLLAQKRAYYEANREEIIEKVRARTDPEAKREYDRQHNQRADVRARRARQRRAWAAAHPEYVAGHNRRRSWVRRNARPDSEAREYIAILLADPCSYCGGEAGQIDHIEPLKLGGDSHWANLTAACAGCNYAKRDKPLLLHLL